MDNGIGILNENKETIFQKGFGRDKRVRGMGIGLSLVKKIIQNYNGEIWVENRVKNDYEQGSNFILLIPEIK
jgi:signal transduction histidine kinase